MHINSDYARQCVKFFFLNFRTPSYRISNINSTSTILPVKISRNLLGMNSKKHENIYQHNDCVGADVLSLQTIITAILLQRKCHHLPTVYKNLKNLSVSRIALNISFKCSISFCQNLPFISDKSPFGAGTQCYNDFLRLHSNLLKTRPRS